MKKLLALVLLALVATSGHAEVFQRDRGVATTLNFKLYNADGTLDVDEVDAGTEVSVSCDEGVETTATNDFADEGTFYSIALTAAEMECNRIAVVVAATTTEVFFIDTKMPGVITAGTAQSATGTTIVLDSSVAYADDELIGATVLVTGGTGAGQARAITDYVSTTDTATVATWTTTPSGTITYQIHGTAASTGSVSIGAGGITAGSFAAGAIDAAAIAADAIGASELAADAIGASEIAAGAIAAAEIATDAIDADAIAADAVGASELAANAIGASEIADNAIDAASTAADFSTEVQDADIESVNGVTILGDGSATPFGP